MHMTPKKWGTLAWTNYLVYSLLWNPHLDGDALREELFSQYYKDTCEDMKRFYSALKKASENFKYYKHYQFLFDEQGAHRLTTSSFLLEGKQQEEELFPLKHMKFETVLEDPNAGISTADTVRMYR